MNIKDLTASLEYLTEAQLTPFIWGHAGIGKSSVVKQYAEAKGYHFFPFYLGTQSDLGDILGLADFVRNAEGTAIATTFATPEWLKGCIDYCNNNPDSGAIIFLDEFNRARKDILNGMFSLALDKTFHTIKLPKNCHIVAAGNPPTEEYFTTDVNETALMARFVHIKLEPSVEEWVTYAKDRKLENNLIEFIRQQPQLLEDGRSEFELPIKVDRRSYERLSRLFALGTPQNLLTQLMIGILGVERTVAFQNFLKESDKPLMASDILNGVGFEKLEIWSNPANTMSSLLNLTTTNVSNLLTEMNTAGKVLTVDEKKHLFAFLTTVPKDVSYPLIKGQIQARTKTFMDFQTDPIYEKDLVLLVKTSRGSEAKAG